eukprot:RCo014989
MFQQIQDAQRQASQQLLQDAKPVLEGFREAAERFCEDSLEDLEQEVAQLRIESASLGKQLENVHAEHAEVQAQLHSAHEAKKKAEQALHRAHRKQGEGEMLAELYDSEEKQAAALARRRVDAELETLTSMPLLCKVFEIDVMGSKHSSHRSQGLYARINHLPLKIFTIEKTEWKEVNPALLTAVLALKATESVCRASRTSPTPPDAVFTRFRPCIKKGLCWMEPCIETHARPFNLFAHKPGCSPDQVEGFERAMAGFARCIYDLAVETGTLTALPYDLCFGDGEAELVMGLPLKFPKKDDDWQLTRAVCYLFICLNCVMAAVSDMHIDLL